MVSVPVQCPYCQRTEVIKAGKQTNGARRYQCQDDRSHGGSFSCGTRIAAAHLRFVAKWLTWSSTGVASAIPPACCASVPRP
jgi:InsA N-terminal domain